MNFKKKVFIPCFFLLLTLILCSALFFRVSAKEPTPDSQTESVLLKSTFAKENGKIYYYNRKGNKVRNKWKTIKDKRYYFYKDGHAAVGFCTISGKRYCFTSKGVLRTGWYTKK